MILILMPLLILIVWIIWPRGERTLKEIAIESAKIGAITCGLVALTYIEHVALVFAFTDVYIFYFKTTLMVVFLGIIRISLMLLAFATSDHKTKNQQEQGERSKVWTGH